MLILLKIVDSLLVSIINGALQNDPVDVGGWFSQVLAARKTAAEYTLLTKISLRPLRYQRQKICLPREMCLLLSHRGVVCEICG